MKVRDRYTRDVRAAGGVRTRERAQEARDTSRAPVPLDTVQISGRSLDIQRARLAALQAPEVRQELVDEILGQIGRGEYSISGIDVAPKMIREHLVDAMR